MRTDEPGNAQGGGMRFWRILGCYPLLFPSGHTVIGHVCLTVARMEVENMAKHLVFLGCGLLSHLAGDNASQMPHFWHL